MIKEKTISIVIEFQKGCLTLKNGIGQEEIPVNEIRAMISV